MKTASKNPVNFILNDRISLLICACFSLFVSYYLHDQYWAEADDGGYGYVAQLILDGAIIHRDIQDIHPGIIHFINAFFLSVSNGDLVSLRYPLIIVTVLQSIFVFYIARPYGNWIAIAASMTMSSFGFVLFINPTPNWYALFLTICILGFLLNLKTLSLRNLIIIGLLIGLIFQLRQLTAVFVAVAVTGIIFLEVSKNNTDKRFVSGSAILGVTALLLSVYVWKSSNWSGFVIFGFFPPLALFFIAYKSNVSALTATRIIGVMATGAFLSTVPMLLYHGYHGSIIAWLTDIFIVPFSLVSLPFFDRVQYAYLPAIAFVELFRGDWSALFGLIFWLLLFFTSILLGFETVRSLKKGDKIPKIEIIAIFYGLVSIHYEIPIYLFYSSGLILVSFMLSTPDRKLRATLSVICLVMSANALVSHAGQPLRIWKEIATQTRHAEERALLPRTSIMVSQTQASNYEKILEVIDTCSRRDDTVYSYPMNADINFLSGRNSPFPFFMSSLGLRSDDHVAIAKEVFETAQAPAIIVHRVEDKYNTGFADQLFDGVRSQYNEIITIDGLTFYHRSNHPLHSLCIAEFRS